jgi:hypothetical protein
MPLAAFVNDYLTSSSILSYLSLGVEYDRYSISFVLTLKGVAEHKWQLHKGGQRHSGGSIKYQVGFCHLLLKNSNLAIHGSGEIVATSCNLWVLFGCKKGSFSAIFPHFPEPKKTGFK